MTVATEDKMVKGDIGTLIELVRDTSRVIVSIKSPLW